MPYHPGVHTDVSNELADEKLLSKAKLQFPKGFDEGSGVVAAEAPNTDVKIPPTTKVIPAKERKPRPRRRTTLLDAKSWTVT